MTIDAKTSLLNLYQELVDKAASNKNLQKDLASVTSDSKAADRVAKQFFLKEETTEKGVSFHFSAKSFWDTLWGGLRKLFTREPPKEYNFDKNFADIAQQFEQLSDPRSKEIIVQDPTEAQHLANLQAILNALAKNVQGKGAHAKVISAISQTILAPTGKAETRVSEVKAPASSFTQQAKALIKQLKELSEGQSEQLKDFLRPIQEKLSQLAQQQGGEIGASHKNALASAQDAIGQIDMLKERFAVQARQGHVQHLQTGVDAAFAKISWVEETAKSKGLAKTLLETFPIVKLDQETRQMLETAQNVVNDPGQWEAVRSDLDMALKNIEQLANRLEIWIDVQDSLSGVSKARNFLSGDDNVEMRDALEQQLPKAVTDDKLESISKQLEGPLNQSLDLATISREKDELCSKVNGNRLITKAFEVETKSRLFKIADFRHKCEIVQGRISNLRLQVPAETKEAFEKQSRLGELEKALESHNERSQDPLFLNAELSEPWNQWEMESQQLFSQADLVLSSASDSLKKLTRRPEENELQTFETNAKRLVKSLASIPEKIASGMKIKHEINELHKALQEHIVDGKTSFDPPEKWLDWKAKATTLVSQAEAISQKTQGWIALMERSKKSRREYEVATSKLLENCYIPGRPPLLGNDSVQQLFELFSDPQYKQEEIQQLQMAFLKNVKDYEAALVSSYKEDPASQSLKEKNVQEVLAERRNALETEERGEVAQAEPTSQMCKLYLIEFSDLQQKGFDLLRIQPPKTLEELKELSNPEKFRQRLASQDEKFASLLQQVQKRREQVAAGVEKLQIASNAFVEQYLAPTIQKLQQTAKEFAKAPDKAWAYKVTDDMATYCRAQKTELVDLPKPPTSPELYEKWEKETQAKQQAQMAQLTTLCQKLLASKDPESLVKVCEESILSSKSKTIQQTISDIRKTYAKALSDFPFAKEAINKIESEAGDLLRSEKRPQELMKSADKLLSGLSSTVNQLLAIRSEIKERSLDKDKVVAVIRQLGKKVERLGDIQEKVNRNLEFALASLKEKFPKLFEVPEETGEVEEEESVEEISFEDFEALEIWLSDALEVQENALSLELYQESMKTNRQLCDYIRLRLAPTFENSLVQYLEIQGVMHKLQKVTAEMSGQKERMSPSQKAMLDVCQQLLNRQVSLLTLKESKSLDDLEAALTQIPPKDLQAHSLFLEKLGQWVKDPNKYVTDEQLNALSTLLKGANVNVDMALLGKVGAFLATDEGASVAGILQTARSDDKQVLQKKKAVSLKAIEEALLESLPLQERVSATKAAIVQKKTQMTPVQVKLCDLLEKHVGKIAQVLQRRVEVPQPDRELDSYRTILTSLTKWLAKPNDVVTDEQIQSLVALVERYEESVDLVLFQLITTYLTSDQGAGAQVKIGRADRDVQIRQLLTAKKADTLSKIEAEAIKKAPKDVKLKSQETWNRQLAKNWTAVDAISTDLFGEHEEFTKLIDELKPKMERFYSDKGLWNPTRYEEIEKALAGLETACNAQADLQKYLEPIQALKEVLSKAKEAL